jgi:asparagine synthase (glutamine-hydrolysing)
MCGIAGVVRRAGVDERDGECLRRMEGALFHRGPDGAGRYVGEHLAMAMRRLSIIDLAGGWQPLYNEDRSLALVANGEIYNYVELRERLIGRGHRFATSSDCETILHAYEEYGGDCVHHLRGMFAFALWDSNRNTLTLARDRMGEKPLYLAETDGRLVFASELRTLMSSGYLPFDLDPEAVHLFYHYHFVPEPRTAIRGVRKLPAGHVLTVRTEPWELSQRCYWRMDDAPAIEGDPAELVRAQLDDVASIVIRSDVPVGVALSGGLDSSAVAALAARKYPGTIHAFSVGYPGRPPCDERDEAKALADHLRMPFHEIELATEDLVRAFPAVTFGCDDPIADISSFGYHSVSRLAREKGVPVLLQGQGGDELFWGYTWVRQAVENSRQRSRSVPADGFVDRLSFFDLHPDFQHAQRDLPGVYTRAFREALEWASPYAPFTLPRPWPDLGVLVTRLISETYLLENGMAQGDRLSMSNSVELRLPFVDYRLVETAIGLRKRYPGDDGLPPKAWLREALKDLLPEWVLARQKRGFTPPVKEWYAGLFNAHGGSLVDGYLVSQGIITPEAARELSTGPQPRGSVFPISFGTLVLESWCRQMSAVVPSSSSPERFACLTA